MSETQKVIPSIIEQEMKSSYLDYSMSVIVARALPDVRDGLKPVHRRVLYAMWDMGMLHNKPYKKSARIVGEVLGKYHPHGDSAAYASLVRMAQDFSLRYPLIQGQGNFGSIDGDNAAAMRYTEARLRRIAEELLHDIDKETVKWVPNFDGSLKEPLVLPAKLPNLLINGSSGIAVGMATSIPPHNLVEVCDGVAPYIDNPDATVLDLMQFIKAPDFPTGGVMMGTAGILDAYKTGKGKAIVRAKTRVEEHKNKQRIIVTEIPYMVNKATLLEDIAHLVNDKKIPGISDLRDESDRQGLRIVIELKQAANADVVLNQLYTHTRLQDTFGITLLGLVENQPKVFTLKGLVREFVEHRRNVVRKRTEFDLTKAEERAHILEGLLVALNDIDDVVQLIKQSKSAEDAKKALMQDYQLTEKQAQAILDMTLRRLTGLEQEKIRNEHKELLVLIEELKAILADEQRILDLIKKELEEIKQKYGDERRTTISEAIEKFESEDLIKPEDVVVTITHAGYVKRMSPDAYKQQKRGGRGIKAAETKEEDFIEDLFVANTHDYLLLFTNIGKVHWLKVHQIPESGRYAKGSAIVNLLQLENDEKITAFIPVKEFKKDNYLFMVTEQGTVKKTSLDQFSNPRRGGIRALGLDKEDELIQVLLTDGERNIIIATANGNAVKFNEKDVRAVGRTATGVRGIRLRDDKVVGATVAYPNKTLLTITEKGYGKRTPMEDYRQTARGGGGVINIKITDKNGRVAAIAAVDNEEEIMIITQKGVLIRTAVKGISIIGRNTQGVRVMKLDDGDKVRSFTKVLENGD
ncbi:DNA gyrase subunit A [Candidatus Woesearchaeota archaeon]|nr:DNA gyrase subunit A [Candidatus Woesearchaeota archaeon]